MKQFLPGNNEDEEDKPDLFGTSRYNEKLYSCTDLGLKIFKNIWSTMYKRECKKNRLYRGHVPQTLTPKIYSTKNALKKNSGHAESLL